MEWENYDELEYTAYATESMYDIVDDAFFRDQGITYFACGGFPALNLLFV